jgi:hypothetical protein
MVDVAGIEPVSLTACLLAKLSHHLIVSFNLLLHGVGRF